MTKETFSEVNRAVSRIQSTAISAASPYSRSFRNSAGTYKKNFN